METWNVRLEYWTTVEAETREEAIDIAYDRFYSDTHPEIDVGYCEIVD